METPQETFDRVARSLTNVAPGADQIKRIEHVRETAKMLLSDIAHKCPGSRERSLALTHLEETVMWAVKSIVLEEE